MQPETRRLAGILLVIFPAVVFGGVSILTFLINDPRYMRNPPRQDLWRAGLIALRERLRAGAEDGAN